MQLIFDNIAEVREFIAGLKGTRGKKGEGDDASGDTQTGGPVALPGAGGAPAPIMPQPQGYPPQQPGPGTMPQTSGFVQAQPNFAPQGQAYPPQQQGVDPVVAGLVQRIVVKIDASVQNGQSAVEALNWFRGQCGPDAANATIDHIKQHFLFRLPVTQLEQIAKMMAA